MSTPAPALAGIDQGEQPTCSLAAHPGHLGVRVFGVTALADTAEVTLHDPADPSWTPRNPTTGGLDSTQ